ncbi:hypothetical protein KC349_g4483 [Hortaea werneckii]|nr:hypothetical protein KC349_g4483 [Hortaea werneckii]
MLERAKACLHSGARDSLRCAQSAPGHHHHHYHHRSTRTLHSSFWTHGAGDLELPPWLLSSNPAHGLSAHGDSSGGKSGIRKRRGRESTATVEASDGSLFLDFLYPPQALAWLNKTGGQPREKWEGRNARRLPDGFVQTSRGYTSRAYSQPARAQAHDESERHGHRRDDTSRRPGPSHPLVGELMSEAGKAEEPGKGTASDSEGGRDITQELLRLSGDHGEEQTDAMAKLSNTMFASRDSYKRLQSDKALLLSDRVLGLYDSLQDSDREDSRLKVELLCWLAPYTTTQAEALCTELYRTIPMEERTLPVYQAALNVFLRRGRHVQALILHKEALQNIGNGDQVTKTFFTYAILEHRWPLAMNIESQHQAALASSQRDGGVGKSNMFWFQVSQIPQLLPHAMEFAKYLKSLAQAKTDNEQVYTFARRFIREALLQEFESPDPAKYKTSVAPQGGSSLAKHEIGRLFGHLRGLIDAAKLYERLLFSMISLNRRYPYPHIHRIVSFVYKELRKKAASEGHRVDEGVLLTLLDRLTHFWGALAVKREIHHSVSVNQLVRDWETDHGKVSFDGVSHLLRWYSSQGDSANFGAWWAYLLQHYPDFTARKPLLANKIYLHARRADLAKAKEAFGEVQEALREHDEPMPTACWNVLIHAYSRDDDLNGGLEVLSDMLEQGFKPDEYSFHPIMEMLARRGDVEGVRDLLHQYDTLVGKQREASFYGSLIQALVNSGDMEEAETTLKESLVEVRSARVRGSLTGSFNIIITAYALRRDVDATMQTYRWMKSENIRLNSETFGALIQALSSYRQTHAAFKILRVVMPEHGCRPTAFHYALCMTGYINQKMFKEALEVHKHMTTRKIKPSVSSNAAYLEARARKEEIERNLWGRRDQSWDSRDRLNETMKDLKRLLQKFGEGDNAVKDPQHRLGSGTRVRSVSGAYFSTLIYIHGQTRCFAAVKQLLEEYRSHGRKVTGMTDIQAPIDMIGALMMAHLTAGQHDEVERCWDLAKEQANEISKTEPVPQLKSPNEDAESEQPRDILQLQPPSDAQEAGFQINSKSTAPSKTTANEKVTASTKRSQTLMPSNGQSDPTTPKPSPGRSYVLTRPLRLYLYSLGAQQRMRDMLTIVSRLFTQGYTMDNSTWNAFIQLLCQSSPPLVLLAYTLTERFLIPNFPGWAPVSTGGYVPHPAARQQGLQYIRARYLSPGQLMPQYKTLVHLGAAVLQLRSIEAMGRRGQIGDLAGMEKYIGSMRQLRKEAPRTLFAVQSMPKVDDALQNRLLRRQ